MATAIQPTGAPLSSGTSVPGFEPIGGSPHRVDCELTDQLNVIVGFAELLLESDRLDARHHRYASLIAASGARACTILRAFFQEYRAGSRTGMVLNEASSSSNPASLTRTSDGQ
jgi:hypothetical protein